MRHKNGQWVWVADCGKVLTRSADGKPLRMLGTHTDITVRKRAEDELKESEERFRSMFEGHSAIMIVIDPETGAIVDANQAAADFYGWSITELLQMSIQQINTFSPDAIRRELQKWEVMEQNCMSFRHRRADGSIRDVEIFAKKIEVKGRPLIYDIVHDVTVRRRFEAIAAIRIRMLEQAKTVSVGELLQSALDEVEKITDSSVGFAHLVTEDQTSLLAQTFSSNTLEHTGGDTDVLDDIYPLSMAGVWADAVRERRVVIHNDYASLEHRKGMPEKHLPIRREMVVPVVRCGVVKAIMGVGNKPSNYDEDDARWVQSVVDHAWDIIEKKLAEEEYLRLEEQLHHSRKMEMVGQLASGIAHEINNPLNFIKINFETLKEYLADFLSLFVEYRKVTNACVAAGSCDDSVLKNLRRVQQKDAEIGIDVCIGEIRDIFSDSERGVDRIKKIVEGMRSLSYRHDADKKVLSDFNKGITETLIVTRHEYRFCADIVTNLENLPLVPCIPDQINQVQLNLIVNGAHAIQQQQRSSKGTITIHTWSDKNNVYCSIADDGPGIPAAIRSQIFNPFFTTKAAGKGTGLGLSISWDIIVNKHKGTLSVECPQKGGTVFTFSLPLNPTIELQESNEKSD